jgi:hypothetical protein
VVYAKPTQDGDPVAELTLRFDPFGGRRLQRAADGQGRTLEGLLADALAHLDAGTQRDRLAAVPPRFVGRRSQARLSIQLTTASARLEHLRGEARRRQVPVERLLEHALLLYLADVETGDVRA